MKNKLNKELVGNFVSGFKAIIKDEAKDAFVAWSVGSALLTISKAIKK